VKSFLEKSDISVIPLPAHSPDLNPIENFWHTIKTIVYRDGRSYDTLAQLEAAIVKTWNEYPQEKINEMIGSYGKRLIAVVIAQGGSTKY
jgi:transposase